MYPHLCHLSLHGYSGCIHSLPVQCINIFWEVLWCECMWCMYSHLGKYRKTILASHLCADFVPGLVREMPESEIQVKVSPTWPKTEQKLVPQFPRKES